MPILKLNKVNSSYGQIHVLWDVDLVVEEKSITGLIGPNGTGKSTLLKTILGTIYPSSGEIHFNGERIDRLPPKEIVKRGVVYVPEGRRVFPEMTVEENLNLGAMNPKARDEREENLREVYQIFPVLKERRHQLAGTLSGGELQFLAIGRGVMGSPQLLMIDEPSLGLSPIAINNVFETIRKINQLGKTILIVEQNVPRLLKIASYTYLMENGKIARSGPSEILEKDEYITRSYLGIL
jgi:branched-chain amino acid transport system ATP-binding protein